jgi:hypothetical protein
MAALKPQTRKWTRAEYYRMADLGWFGVGPHHDRKVGEKSGRVGMGVASHPSHSSVLAQLTHTARQATDSLRAVTRAHAATATAVPSASRSTAPT